MSNVPAGISCLTIAQDRLLQSFRDSEKFQQFIDVNNPTCNDIEDKLHLDSLPRPEGKDFSREEYNRYYPFALIAPDDQAGPFIQYDLEATISSFTASGVLFVQMGRFLPQQDDRTVAHQEREFYDQVIPVLEEVMSFIAKPGYLWFRSVAVTALGRSDANREATIGPRQFLEAHFFWGTETGAEG